MKRLRSPKEQKQQRRQVTFDTTAAATIYHSIDSLKHDLDSNDKAALFMTNQELLSIRSDARDLIRRIEYYRLVGMSSGGPLLQLHEDYEENSGSSMRGLETYAHPGKFESALRKTNAFAAVLDGQKEGKTGEDIAASYTPIAAVALEKARKRAVMDQERAWSKEELEQYHTPRAPTHQTMDR